MWDFMEPTDEIAVSSGMWNDGGSFLDQDLSTWESNSKQSTGPEMIAGSAVSRLI